MSIEEYNFRKALEEVERGLGYTFKDRGLLEQAATHRSYANETDPARADNERLEFLGDAVLQLIVSEQIYQLFPHMPEGEMTRCRANIVRATSLAAIADSLGLGNVLRLGKGEAATGGRRKSRILSNALEAVLAAVYVESGLEAARAVCGRLLAGRFLPRDELAKADPKNRLQELLQEMGRPSPSYHLLEQSGPPHARKFVIEARVGDESLARGVASSKKEAARLAAEASLEVVVRRKGGGP